MRPVAIACLVAMYPDRTTAEHVVAEALDVNHDRIQTAGVVVIGAGWMPKDWSADGYLGIERSMEVGDAPVSVDIVLLKLPGLQ
jgi:hypothetical protein